MFEAAFKRDADGRTLADFRIDDDENAIAQLNRLYQKNADALIEDYDGWVERVRSGNQGG